MRNLAQSTKSLENDLIKSIRGYDGYEIPKARSKTDKRVREFLSDQLKQIESDLSRFESVLQQYNNNTYRDTFHRVSSILKLVIQSLGEPSYNDTQFFNQAKVSPDKLTQLYEYEIQLVNQVGILVDEVQELDSINGEYEIEDILNHLFDVIDGVNQTLSEREFMIIGEVD